MSNMADKTNFSARVHQRLRMEMSPKKNPKWMDKRMQTPAGSVYIFLMFQIRFPRRRNEMSRLQAYYWCVCLSLSLSGPVVGCLCVSSIDVGSSFPFARLSYKESKLTGRERRKQKRKK